jgi:hypothetical protein
MISFRIELDVEEPTTKMCARREQKKSRGYDSHDIQNCAGAKGRRCTAICHRLFSSRQEHTFQDESYAIDQLLVYQAQERSRMLLREDQDLLFSGDGEEVEPATAISYPFEAGNALLELVRIGS